MIRASQISYAANGTEILDRISLELKAGELVGLIGPNGSGKSTLLRLLAGILEPSQGELCFNSSPYAPDNRHERARKIAYLAQESTIHWPIEVQRVVELGRIPHLSHRPSPDGEGREWVEAALRETDTLHLKQRSVATLSGGERARVLFARALASQPAIILADEPTAALDPAHQLSILQRLRARCDNGLCACVSLHDLSIAATFCDRLILLHQGRMIADGDTEGVLTLDHLHTIYAITPVDPTLPITRLLRHPWRTTPEKGDKQP